MSQAWQRLRERFEEIEAISQAMGLLEWDHQTHMPPRGAAARGHQLAALAAIQHSKLTDPVIGELLGELTDATDPVIAAGVRNATRHYTRAVALPTALVSALSEACTAGHAGWMAAREANDFAPFAASLARIVELTQQKIACYGDAAHPYDHLLSEHDPGTTTAGLRPMFSQLSEALVPLVDRITAAPTPPPLSLTAPLEGMRALNRAVVEALGFDLAAGRLDEAEHPFTLGITPADVRLTTHYHLDDLLGTLAGTIHETGHGLYEQGRPDRAGTWTDGAAGMGMHESQSRFWENCIGRSLPFCRWLVGQLDATMPGHGLHAERLFTAANRVERSLVRIHADELTYNLHIIVRFELELALVSGDLHVSALPGVWDDTYHRIVGVRPPDARQGVLQDVHWSAGLLGYFPSYTIGNLYAASYKAVLEQQLPDLWSQVEAGDFAPVLRWLREHIHSVGHLHDAPEIFAAAVGDRDPVEDLMAHLAERQAQVSAMM